MNEWLGREAASRLRQWPWIVDLAERVSSLGWASGLLLLGSFARSAADSLSDVDFIVLVRDGCFDEAWEQRHGLHAADVVCWDYPRPDEREVAAHRWLTDDFVLFDGLIATSNGVRIRDQFVVLQGEPSVGNRIARIDPTRARGDEISLHEVERLYGQLKLAARASQRSEGPCR